MNSLASVRWHLPHVLGMFTFASLTIDRAPAHIWLGGPYIDTVDLGHPISERHLVRVASQPEVEQSEIYLQERTYWIRHDGGQELCLIIGTRLADGSLGAVPELSPDLRRRLVSRGRSSIPRAAPSRRNSLQAIGSVAIDTTVVKIRSECAL